jgi:hypothetical protein
MKAMIQRLALMSCVAFVSAIGLASAATTAVDTGTAGSTTSTHTASGPVAQRGCPVCNGLCCSG